MWLQKWLPHTVLSVNLAWHETLHLLLILFSDINPLSVTQPTKPNEVFRFISHIAVGWYMRICTYLCMLYVTAIVVLVVLTDIVVPHSISSILYTTEYRYHITHSMKWNVPVLHFCDSGIKPIWFVYANKHIRNAAVGII
jgi:hypothetical protein